ncbi:MAG: hypothetical protein ACRCXB_23145 [Aeromonadaceae bacterium]
MNKNDLIRGTADLKAFVKNTKASGKALDQAIQIMLASTCAHLHAHGNIAVVADAVDALPAGARTNAAKEYVLRFAPVNYNEKKKEFVFAAGKRVEQFEESELCQTMLDTLWTDLKPEAPFRPFDLTAQVQQLLKKALKRKEEANEGDEIDQSEIDQLQALSDQLAVAKAAKAEALKAQQAAEALEDNAAQAAPAAE